MMSGIVFAAAEDKSSVTALNTNELSLYTTPQQKFRYVKPEMGQLEQGVATIRKMAEPYGIWCQLTGYSAVEKVQGAYGKVKPQMENLIQFGNESYAYVKNPQSEFYPRAGVIGLAGFLGIFLARGSRVKTIIYPSGLMAVSASLYYPQQAASIAKVYFTHLGSQDKLTGDYVYDFALQGYVAMENVFKSASKLTIKKSVSKEKPEEKSIAAETKS